MVGGEGGWNEGRWVVGDESGWLVVKVDGKITTKASRKVDTYVYVVSLLRAR